MTEKSHKITKSRVGERKHALSMAEQAAAELIATHGIDVAVDHGGFTAAAASDPRFAAAVADCRHTSHEYGGARGPIDRYEFPDGSALVASDDRRWGVGLSAEACRDPDIIAMWEAFGSGYPPVEFIWAAALQPEIPLITFPSGTYPHDG